METSARKVNWFNIIPLVLIVGIVPLIVHLKVFKLDNEAYKYFNLVTNYDFYSYYKMTFFLILSAVALLITGMKFIIGDFNVKRTKINIFILLFSIMAIFSYILSQNRDIALIGFYDRYEGIIVLLAYMFILFYTINIVDTEKEIWLVTYALLFCSFIIGVIGIMQFLGHDPLSTYYGKRLMSFGVADIDINKISTTIEKYMTYGTLYNPDYVGSFTAILFPFFLSLTVLLKNRKNKFLFGIFSLLMFIILIGSRSRAGILGTAAALFVFVVLKRDLILKRWKYIIPIVIGIIALVFGANKITHNALFSKLFTTGIDTRISVNAGGIDNVSISGNTVSIFTQDDVLNITIDANGVLFKDVNNNTVPTTVNNGKITLNEDKYKNFSFQLAIMNKIHVLGANIDNVQLAFAATDKGVKFVNSRRQLVDIPQQVESFGFSGNQQFASARGYIWSRSLPLLKDTILVGHGPDTFALYFPQDDYVGKLKAYGTTGMFVDKPHNFYLQTALNTGVISLIALLGIFAAYIALSFKLYFKADYSEIYSTFGVSIFLGIIGYLVAAFFNDSVISVAPVFWVLLGIGISINLRLSKPAKLRNKMNISK